MLPPFLIKHMTLILYTLINKHSEQLESPKMAMQGSAGRGLRKARQTKDDLDIVAHTSSIQTRPITANRQMIDFTSPTVEKREVRELDLSELLHSAQLSSKHVPSDSIEAIDHQLYMLQQQREHLTKVRSELMGQLDHLKQETAFFASQLDESDEERTEE